MSEAPGWYPDPYFLGRERYWDGRVWTEQCRVSATKESQPSAAPRPPKDPETATPSATAARAAARAGAAASATATATKAPPRPDPKTDGAGPKRTVPTAPTAPPRPAGTAAAAAAAATVTVTAQQPNVRTPGPTQHTGQHNGRASRFAPPPKEPSTQPVGVKTDEPGTPEEARTEQVTLGPEPKKAKAPPTAKKDDRDPAARRRRKILLGGIAAAVVVLAVLAIVLLVRHSGGSNTSDVAKAAQATERQHTAAVTFVVKPAGGQDASGAAASGLTGNGNFDFKDSTGSTTLSASGSGSGGPEQLIVQKDQSVLLDPGSLVGQLVPGKSWIAVTADDLGSSATPTGFAVAPTVFEEMVGNPRLWLKELRATGVTSTPFGESTFQGTPVHGYAVTLPQKAIEHRLSALPPSLRAVAAGVHGTEDVYVATNGLVKAIVVPVTIHSGSSTSTEDVTVTFSGWGNPVHIVTPTLNQIVSWAQFKAVLTFATKLG